MPSTISPALIAAIGLVCGLSSSPAPAGTGHDLARDNAVRWRSLGANENDSMPIGNGDLAANVWTEANGDLLILLAKADAWSETGDLVKLGRVRIHFDVNPFSPDRFTQTLLIADGSERFFSWCRLKKDRNF